MKLHSDLREFVELLNSRGVEYVIVGGHAVAFHGHPRFTGDIDFLIAANPDNAARVLGCLAAFGFPDLGLAVDDLLQPGQIVQLGRPPNRIDLLTSISGVEFDDAWSERLPFELEGCLIWIPSIRHLIQNKRASGRLKDLADVEALEALCEPDDRGPARF